MVIFFLDKVKRFSHMKIMIQLRMYQAHASPVFYSFFRIFINFRVFKQVLCQFIIFLCHIYNKSVQLFRNKQVTHNQHYSKMQIRQFSHLQAESNTTANETIANKLVKHVSSFPLYAIIMIIVAFLLLIIVIIICILRKKTRDKYQESPQHFSRKPNLSFFQKINYKSMSIKNALSEGGQQIQKKTSYQGEMFEIKFKAEKNCLYFSHKLKNDSYFEIEIIKLSSFVQIGFIPVEHFDDLIEIDEKLIKINLDRYGVALATDGDVIADGEKKFNIDWNLSYGDVIGIGITKHKTGIRVWVTRNGILLNKASEEQMLKNIDLNKEEARHPKQQKQDDQAVDNDEQKIQILQQLKKKVELKKPKKHQYYAVVTSEGASKDHQTIINWNVGAHTFRLFDGNNLTGLIN